MKKLIFLLLVFAGFTACENESIQELPQETSVTEGITAKQNNKVDVCHNGNIINVSVSSLSAHQGHGDAVDMDGDGYFDIENGCSEGVDCDDNAYSEDNSCYPFTCGADIDFSNLDIDFSNLDFAYSRHCSNYEYNGNCGSETVTTVYFEFLDSEGYYLYYSVSAFDLRNFTCAEYYDDYLITVSSETYNSESNGFEYCRETWGCNDCGDINMGPGTVELYDEVVGFINNLAADLGIEDECANDARSSGAVPVNTMESMPDELKKILEERKALLPFDK